MDKFESFCKKTSIFQLIYNLNVCVPIIVGGYGISKVLNTKKIVTKDIDIHLCIDNANKTTMKNIKNVIHHIVDTFIKFAKLDQSKVQIKTYSKSFIIQKPFPIKIHKMYFVTYKNAPLFDFTITTEVTKHLDLQRLQSTGLPLKTIKGYIAELYSLILRGSIQGLNDSTYKKRNPVHGVLKEKGSRNFERLKMLCKHEDSDYCKITAAVKIKDADILSSYLRLLTD